MRRQSSGGGAAVDYVMPFLILICVGVIFVLLFNLWRALFAPVSEEAAYMHIVEGSVQLKVWGTEDYFALDSDTLIMQGDALKTDGGSKVIVEFFDGTIMRIDSASELVFNSIDHDTKTPEINVSLEEGDLWFNKVYKNSVDTNVVVDMGDIIVNSELASVFMLSSSNEGKAVRVANVFDSNEGLMVSVMSEDGSSVVESEKIGIAQEIVFTSDVLARYWKFQSPTVLRGIADQFKTTEWYAWNLGEDESPSQTVREAGGTENVGLIPVESQKITPGEEDLIEVEPEEDVVDEEVIAEEEPVVKLGSLSAPVMISVSGSTEKDSNGFYVVRSNPATLFGSVSGATNVVVNGYTLSKFKSGDSGWTYYANADYNLLVEGENLYEIYALDADGNKSEVTTVKVFYEVPVVETAPVADEVVVPEVPETIAPGE